jgi:hypothetical protein
MLSIANEDSRDMDVLSEQHSIRWRSTIASGAEAVEKGASLQTGRRRC